MISLHHHPLFSSHLPLLQVFSSYPVWWVIFRAYYRRHRGNQGPIFSSKHVKSSCSGNSSLWPVIRLIPAPAISLSSDRHRSYPRWYRPWAHASQSLWQMVWMVSLLNGSLPSAWGSGICARGIFRQRRAWHIRWLSCQLGWDACGKSENRTASRLWSGRGSTW